MKKKVFLRMVGSLFIFASLLLAPQSVYAQINNFEEPTTSYIEGDVIIHYRNVDIHKFNDELTRHGWVDTSAFTVRSEQLSERVSELVARQSYPANAVVTRATRYYSGSTNLSGVRSGSSIPVTLHANMEITSVRFGNDYYDVFVRVINTSASLSSSGYAFASSFNIGTTLANGNTELVLTAGIQLQYQQSYAVSGSLSWGWGSIGGSTGSTYYYRGPVNQARVSIKLPAYWLIQ